MMNLFHAICQVFNQKNILLLKPFLGAPPISNHLSVYGQSRENDRSMYVAQLFIAILYARKWFYSQEGSECFR